MLVATLPFQERLLRVMDRKDHPSYWALMGPGATREQLKIHYRQEWGVYVRDFPIFLARILAKGPPPDARRDLAENLFEEETGKLTFGVPHPQLFLRMMEGLGFPRSDFENVELLPAASAYRAWLDRATLRATWLVGAAVATVFVEGSRKDRAGVEGKADPEPPVEEKLRKHPLVVNHGLDPKFMDLQRAHAKAESGHRAAAWKTVLGYARTEEEQGDVERALKRSLRLWKFYRSEVALACGIGKE